MRASAAAARFPPKEILRDISACSWATCMSTRLDSALAVALAVAAAAQLAPVQGSWLRARSSEARLIQWMSNGVDECLL